MLKDLAAKFELSSATYAAENSITRDPDWYLLKLQEEMGELTQASNRLTGRGRERGLSKDELRRAVADETVDVLGHILLFAHQHEVDIGAAIERKWRFRLDAA